MHIKGTELLLNSHLFPFLDKGALSPKRGSIILLVLRSKEAVILITTAGFWHNNILQAVSPTYLLFILHLRIAFNFQEKETNFCGLLVSSLVACSRPRKRSKGLVSCSGEDYVKSQREVEVKQPAKTRRILPSLD